MAQHGEVHWIAPQAPLVPSNYFAKQVVQSGKWKDIYKEDVSSGELTAAAQVVQSGKWKDIYKEDVSSGELTAAAYAPLSAIGLTGKNEVVGVVDTGLDWNSCFFKDEKIRPQFAWGVQRRTEQRARGIYEVWSDANHRKIRQYVAYMNGEEDEDNGHGTHISGSIAGSCAGSGEDADNSDYNGVAPDAKISLFDMYSATEERRRVLLPKGILNSEYKVGARVYAFTFNEQSLATSSPTNRYNEVDSGLDHFSYVCGDVLIVTSAGNGDQIASPANAKNVLTVGSHYNPDPTSKTYTTEADARGIFAPAPHSARGPTADGRTKPEVYGPGSSVTSAASKAREHTLTAKKKSPSSTTSAMRQHPLVNPHAEHCGVVAKDGTSSATAVVAGVAVLVRQYFSQGYYPNGKKNKLMPGFNPMAALIKAVLVNSARPLTVNGKTPPAESHDPALGWGGVNIASTLVTPHSPKGLQLKVYGRWSFAPNLINPVLKFEEKAEFRIRTTKNIFDLPLKITLVWLDPSAEPYSTSNLIYDLDLQVAVSLGKGKRGDIFYPNGLTAGPDSKNTVEHIHIAKPTPDTKYVITVRSSGASAMELPYALVISGPFNSKKVTRKNVNDYKF